MPQHNLRETDSEVADLIAGEEQRQREKIRMIASENYASRAVLEKARRVAAHLLACGPCAEDNQGLLLAAGAIS